MSDSTMIAAAHRWIDELNSGLGVHGSWKLQRLEKRVRSHIESSTSSSTGVTTSELPTRLRRFAKGIPWSLIVGAANYLHSLAPYRDIVVNGIKSDEKYVPTRTWWERDEGNVVDRGQQNEGTYTLYQDLIDKDHLDDVEFDSGGSCSEKVTAKHYYDAFEIEDTAPGGQGITKSIQAVSRAEDGTFNYAVITRQALTQDLGEKTTKDDEFETVKIRTWDNVYTSGSNYVDQNGSTLPIPSPASSGNGTVIELSIQENPDCTLKITAQTTTSKPVVSEKSSSATVFEISKRTAKRVEDSSDYSEVTTASGGHTFARKLEKRPDGKIDITEESKTEQSVDDAVIEVRKTLRSVKVARTDRNQSPIGIEEARGMVTKIGQSVRVEKTDGGLVNITFESTAESPVGKVRSECQKTVFVHSHTVTNNQKSDPGESAVSASGGVVHIKSATRTEDGTWDVTSEARTEQSVDDAVIEIRKTLRSVKIARTDRNQTPIGISEARGMVTKIGQSVRVEKTDGGLVNVTFESTDESPVGKVRSECQRTIFVHSHSVTNNQKSDPGESTSAASGGVIRSKSANRTEDGTWDVTNESRTEQSVDDAVIEIRKTLRSIKVARTDRNQAPIGLSEAKGRVTKVGQSIRVEKTDGGLANITFESTASESVGDLREECQKTTFVHTHAKTHNQKNDPGSIEAATASGGVIHIRSKARTDDGTFDITSESRTEQSVDDAVIEIRKTLRSVKIARTDRNQAVVGIEAAKGMVTKVGQSVRIEKTDGGLANITFESTAESPVGGVRHECQKTIFLHSHSVTNNQKSDPGESVTTASGGVIRSRSASRTEDGTWDVTDESRTEQSVADAVIEVRKTLRSVKVIRTDRNHAPVDIAGAKGMVTKVGQSVRIEKTDGGMANVTFESTAESPVGKVRSECQKTVFIHSHTVANNQKSDPGESTTSAASGVVHTKSATKTEDGTWDVVEKTDTEIPQSRATVVRRKTTSGVVVTTTSRNSDNDSSGIDGSYGDEVRVEMTDGGKYNRTVTKVTPAEMISWEVVVDLEMLYQKTVYFKNATEDEYQDLVDDLTDEINDKVSDWEEDDRAPSSYGAEPSVNLEETGKFSGAVTITARWANGSAGQTGEANMIQFEYTYRDIGYGKYTKIAQGRGRTKLQSFLNGCGRTAESVSISFDPTTQMWHASFTERNEGK